MKLGRLEIRFKWHKKKKETKPADKSCPVCREIVKYKTKGTHVLNGHPEYKIERTIVLTKGGQYETYKCSLCEAKNTSITRIVQHIKEKHGNLEVSS